jgi:hypothetical protein
VGAHYGLRMKINSSDELIEYVNDNCQIIKDIARIFDIEEFDLRINILLYLPRILDKELTSSIFEAEMNRVAKVIYERQQPFKVMYLPNGIELKDLSFEILPESSAKVFHEAFHYLNSYRPGTHYCLINKCNYIVSMLTLSPYDLFHLKLEPDKTLVLSRAFTFRNCPKNAFSYLFSRAFRYERSKNRKLNQVITYFNENLGFKGTSYNPSEWKFHSYANKTRYEYNNGLYVTKRNIKENNLKNIETSKIPLKPQKVLIYGGNK